jgi:hypothetical protein
MSRAQVWRFSGKGLVPPMGGGCKARLDTSNVTAGNAAELPNRLPVCQCAFGSEGHFHAYCHKAALGWAHLGSIRRSRATRSTSGQAIIISGAETQRPGPRPASESASGRHLVGGPGAARKPVTGHFLKAIGTGPHAGPCGKPRQRDEPHAPGSNEPDAAFGRRPWLGPRTPSEPLNHA